MKKAVTAVRKSANSAKKRLRQQDKYGSDEPFREFSY
jgi:hypothetical protein